MKKKSIPILFIVKIDIFLITSEQTNQSCHFVAIEFFYVTLKNNNFEALQLLNMTLKQLGAFENMLGTCCANDIGQHGVNQILRSIQTRRQKNSHLIPDNTAKRPKLMSNK
ncbi:hypothetical protein BpHYR1_034189 [Brachionus plicatilis]|uniref:Uncharacterized protein n=1 Tax=Brachionus plicatilis TaxID=10195 RepID=A0A3M7RVR0_BRAPC|nr:hypothetical protein BpHYR1_034189 [Brachionus plicatilis]